jgi:hypothetical protein
MDYLNGKPVQPQSQSQIPPNPFVVGKCWYYDGDLSDHRYPNTLPGPMNPGNEQDSSDSSDVVIFMGGVSEGPKGELRKYFGPL